MQSKCAVHSDAIRTFSTEKRWTDPLSSCATNDQQILFLWYSSQILTVKLKYFKINKINVRLQTEPIYLMAFRNY